MNQVLWRKPLIVVAVTLVVIRICAAAFIPFTFLSHDWEMAIKMKCLERRDLCVSVHSQDALVGGYWHGRALYFTVRAGKAHQFKSVVVQGMPDGVLLRYLSPWAYVGAAFTEELPLDSQ